MKMCTAISLADDERTELEAICLCHSSDVLAWKRAQAIILLDAEEDPETICRMFNIDSAVFTEWCRAFSADGLASFSLNSLKDNSKASISLTEDERAEIKKICRRRKEVNLIWKRARAIILMADGYDARILCEVLDIGPTVLAEWRRAFSAERLAFFGLKDYSQREGHLSFAQEEALKEHFTEHPPLKTRMVCDYILAKYGQNYTVSGAVKLMKRLGFE